MERDHYRPYPIPRTRRQETPQRGNQSGKVPDGESGPENSRFFGEDRARIPSGCDQGVGPPRRNLTARFDHRGSRHRRRHDPGAAARPARRRARPGERRLQDRPRHDGAAVVEADPGVLRRRRDGTGHRRHDHHRTRHRRAAQPARPGDRRGSLPSGRLGEVTPSRAKSADGRNEDERCDKDRPCHAEDK